MVDLSVFDLCVFDPSAVDLSAVDLTAADLRTVDLSMVDLLAVDPLTESSKHRYWRRHKNPGDMLTTTTQWTTQVSPPRRTRVLIAI